MCAYCKRRGAARRFKGSSSAAGRIFFYSQKSTNKKEIKKGPSASRNPAIVAGVTRFVAAALPRPPTRAIILGDRTHQTGFTRAHHAWFRRARSASAVAPPVRTGGFCGWGAVSYLAARYFAPDRGPEPPSEVRNLEFLTILVTATHSKLFARIWRPLLLNQTKPKTVFRQALKPEKS